MEPSGPELRPDPWPDRLGRLGTTCSQVRWQLPPMTSRLPRPTSNRSDAPRFALSADRFTGATAQATLSRLSPYRHSPAERLAHLRAEVRSQRLPCGAQHRVRQWRGLAVAAEHPGDRHHLVIHVLFSVRHGTVPASRSKTALEPAPNVQLTGKPGRYSRE